jgi:hypothetical protein
LNAPPAPPSAHPELGCDIRTLEGLLDVMRSVGNDLGTAGDRPLARHRRHQAALTAQPGCRLAALSGSGPTCFGVFSDDTAASQAAVALGSAHPQWWIVATRLLNLHRSWHLAVIPAKETERECNHNHDPAAGPFSALRACGNDASLSG